MRAVHRGHATAEITRALATVIRSMSVPTGKWNNDLLRYTSFNMGRDGIEPSMSGLIDALLLFTALGCTVGLIVGH